jgi:DNA-binding response OmpR family regulator
MQMGYQPSLDAPITYFPVGTVTPLPLAPRTGGIPSATRRAPVLARRLLRFGGLSLDKLTGAVEWKEKPLALHEDQREVLAFLMENAGRILTLTQIAQGVGDRLDRTEERVVALRASLRLAGVKCLPRQAAGIGYILWY